jgi:threonine/homoserine/homoserine lactone efflux protein
MPQIILPVAMLLLVAALSPGPNTVVVMRTASRVGFMATLPTVTGIVAGCLTMLLLVVAGAETVVRGHPAIMRWVGIAGALYLIWLGKGLAGGHDEPSAHLPDTARALFVFQFLNPKAWLMTLTAVAAFGSASGRPSWLWLLAMYVAIPSTCLLGWALAGTALSHWLGRADARRRFDAAMGLLLAISGVLLLVHSL